MIRYRKGRPEERAEIVDFANYVFSQAHVPHDFKTLLPKVYADNIDPKFVADCHYLCDVDGKIKAMVACPVFPVTYAGETFRVGAVGTVSVHPYSRREGYMKGVMALMLEDTEKLGADMLVLGGQHQRYQHFGFELAGSAYQFNFSPASVRHAWGKLDAENIRFQIMEREDALLADAFSLYEKRIITGSRTRENFYDVCCSWRATPWAILSDGKFAGYMTASGDGDLHELVLKEEAMRDTVLKAWSLKLGKSFAVGAFPCEKKRIAAWMDTCDGYTVNNEEMIRVLRWLPVLRASMALRCAEGGCQDGSAVLELDGNRYRITVQSGRSTVEETDEPAEASFSGTEAVRRVFGMATGMCPGMRFLKNDWLPLPFNMSGTDKF